MPMGCSSSRGYDLLRTPLRRSLTIESRRKIDPVNRLTEAPPHTRGWTLSQHRGIGKGDGSPAHAGMDPRRRR